MNTFAPSAGSPRPVETPQRDGRRGTGGAGRLGIGLALLTALVLVVFGVAAWASRESPGSSIDKPQIVSMADSARAMQQAGTAMQAHGQAMLDEGRSNNDLDLVAHGEHWMRDGAALIQGGGWMAMNPTAPGSLVAPSEISAADRSQLDRQVQAMIHDPSKASRVDAEALRWNGLSMRSEGQNMADHASVMAEAVELMVERHGLQGQAAADLRQAVQVMRDVSKALTRNGQAMIDYADRVRRSMGLK